MSVSTTKLFFPKKTKNSKQNMTVQLYRMDKI